MSSAEDFLDRALEKQLEKGTLRSLQVFENKIDFQSNDYLGLAHDKTLEKKTNEILGKFSFANGSGGSRLISGNLPIAEATENAISAYFSTESALIFGSGYAANLGLLSCIATKHDTILYDELCHASIRDGIRLSLAKSYSFGHNNVEDLQRLVKLSKGSVFVVTEAVFSMDGDCAPLKELESFCNKNECFLILDEAHATGVLQDDRTKSFARVITFGKACGVHGAAVLGSDKLKKYLVNFSRPFIYSTAPSPHFYASIMASLKVLSTAEKQKSRLHDNIQYFKAKCRHSGLLDSNTPIQSVVIPNEKELNALCEKLNKSGIFIKAIKSPTVPKGKERLRICLHSFNTFEEIDLLTSLIND
jgi:8-amino-7-oxononanoate synthase